MSELINNPPEASALMEASRSFGNYDLAAALADLIDNSISAGANNIRIDCEYRKIDPLIRIADNGCGMNRQELIDAMRPASQNPMEERDEHDLGRFGLGLKTASFSQARELTVISTRDNDTNAATWDLDNIQNWNMRLSSGEEASQLLLENLLFKTKTEIIWRKLDRIMDGGSLERADFNRLITSSADQLSLIFHRYLEGSSNPEHRQIQLYLNGDCLKPHDPFKTKHPATQELETEEMRISNSIITVTPFILPHYSKLARDEYEQLAGEEGYIKNQGFYVYRNRRLIIHGTWFKIVRHGELSKLARVRVDIPNSLDAQWRLTVDKSDAQIPTVVKRRLRDLTEHIGHTSSRVYRQRGSKVQNRNLTPIWVRTVKKGQIKFSVNPSHPAIKSFSDSLGNVQRSIFAELLGMVASGFPVEALHTDYSDNPNKLVQSDATPDDLVIFTERFVSDMLGKGMPSDELLALLKCTEPFDQSYDFLVETLRNSGTIK